MIDLNDRSGPLLGTEAWGDRLAHENSLRQIVLTRPATADDARELAQIDFRRASTAAVINAEFTEAGPAICEAAAAGSAAVLATVMSAGEVVLRWNDGSSRCVPCGASRLPPGDWLRAVACALIARDADSQEILCYPEHISAAQLPPQLADPFWPFLCTAVAAVVRQPAAAGTWLDEAGKLLTLEQVSRADANALHLKIAPLLPLLGALCGRGDWKEALLQALEAHREYFANYGAPGDPERLLPLVITGLAALAFDRRIGQDTAGLMDALVRGDFPRQLVTVEPAYFPRWAGRTEDPMTFLDLEGFPPASRKQAVIKQGGQLIARYRLSGRPGIPRASIDFILPQPGVERGSIPPALDAGERILVAESYAKRAGDAIATGDTSAKMLLQDAIEQVDAVLAEIPTDADRVPEGAFGNPSGVRVYRNEPGRFDRARLIAYRDTLQEQLARLSSSTDGPAGPQIAASEIRSYAAAIAAEEVVRQGVIPLLKELAHDPTGSVAASVRPRPQDYAIVFEGSATEAARAAYEPMWDAGIKVEAISSQYSELRVFVAPAGMLRGPNELSRHFPGGYRSIAMMLKPERVWIAWKYVKPGESIGFAYDGLVWCDDHWAWFPKPYRGLNAGHIM